MSINKFTALFLALVIISGALTSCFFNTAGDLQTDTYVARVRISFATNDEKMRDAVDAMSSSAVLSVHYEKIQLESISSVGDVCVKEGYVYSGSIIYHSNETTVGDKSTSEYKKAPASDVEIESILSKAGAGAGIDLDDFNTQEVLGKDGNYTYTCSEITDAARASLCDVLSSRFAGLDATVILDEASYVLETKNGRNISSVLSCSFKITMNGATYEITAHTYCDYDYDAEVSISTPADSDKYEIVSYEDIIG